MISFDLVSFLRANASKCLDRAQAISNGTVREHWLAVATTWQVLAERAENPGHPIARPADGIGDLPAWTDADY